jgi:hypothetical protein
MEWVRAEIIPFEVRNETRVSTLPTLIQYSARSLSQNNNNKINKRDTNRKRSQIIPIDRLEAWLKK